jgi:hypothetical protein
MDFEIHATKCNLRQSAKSLQLDEIELYHLDIPQHKIFNASVITIRINRQVKVLKDIYRFLEIPS